MDYVDTFTDVRKDTSAYAKNRRSKNYVNFHFYFLNYHGVKHVYAFKTVNPLPSPCSVSQLCHLEVYFLAYKCQIIQLHCNYLAKSFIDLLSYMTF